MLWVTVFSLMDLLVSKTRNALLLDNMPTCKIIVYRRKINLLLGLLQTKNANDEKVFEITNLQILK